MHCPPCTACNTAAPRRGPRLSFWAPLALIAAVLATAALASAMTGGREGAERAAAVAVRGHAL